MVEKQSIVKKLKIVFLNIRSVRNKLDELKLLCSSSKADIVIVNEIWISTLEAPFFKIGGYSEILNCRDHREGGGTAMYISNNIDFNIREQSSNFNTTVAEVLGFGEKFHLMTFYRPPIPNHADFF